MRPRLTICALILLVLALALLLWGRRSRAPVNLEPNQAIRVGAPSNLAPSSPSNQATSGAWQKPGPASGAIAEAGAMLRRHEVSQRAFDQANVPIDFYGRVVDQDTNTLPGVHVRVFIRHWSRANVFGLTGGSPDLYADRTTGPDGRFEVHGETGDGLSVEVIEKAGYELEPTRLNYAPSSGAFENPVIFRMWSTNIHERLISGHKAFPITPDGRPYVVDLTRGTISESGPGDLRAWIKCPGQMPRGQMYDWSCEIDAINGGLLEEHPGVAMYRAPTDGYSPSFQFRRQVKGGQDGSPGEKYFYVKLKDGQGYGAIGIELCAPYNNQIPGLIRLSYTINPSGSRILR